jgi:hypothetical protein
MIEMQWISSKVEFSSSGKMKNSTSSITLSLRMLGNIQLNEILNSLSHSCCFTWCQSRAMLVCYECLKRWFFLFWPSEIHRIAGVGGFLLSAPSHWSKHSSPIYNCPGWTIFHSFIKFGTVVVFFLSCFFCIKCFSSNIHLSKCISNHLLIETFTDQFIHQ